MKRSNKLQIGLKYNVYAACHGSERPALGSAKGLLLVPFMAHSYSTNYFRKFCYYHPSGQGVETMMN